MSASIEVQAWACSQCRSVHASQHEADECCQCESCGEKFARSNSYGRTCESCDYGTNLRNARANVERCAESWRHAQRYLNDLWSKPPSAKKRSRVQLSPEATNDVPETPYIGDDGVMDSSAWAPLREVCDWLEMLATTIERESNGSQDSISQDARRLAGKLARAIPRLGGGRT